MLDSELVVKRVECCYVCEYYRWCNMYVQQQVLYCTCAEFRVEISMCQILYVIERSRTNKHEVKKNEYIPVRFLVDPHVSSLVLPMLSKKKKIIVQI